MRFTLSSASRRWMLALAVAAVAASWAVGFHATGAHAAEPAKIVLIAGKKSHGPVGNGVHDYGWTVRAVRLMLQRSNIADSVRVEHHLDGWPADPAAVADAATLMIVCDGRDGDRYAEALHLETPERVAEVDRLMRRGCGLVLFHFATFAPERYAEQAYEWQGGYFGWETDGRREWFSAIRTLRTDVRLAVEDHPVGRGLPAVFPLEDEFYYRMRFRDGDRRRTPILAAPELGGPLDEHTVAWALERTPRGRSFAITAGHRYDNWADANFRRLLLNAVVWTAGVDPPPGGVAAEFPSRGEIDQALPVAD